MTDDDSGTQSLYGRLDPEQVGAFGLKVWQYKQGELVSLMIHLGDRLGIYRTLQGRGPVTVAELAEASGLKERWLLEWLRGQTAAGLIEYHGAENGGEPRFELSDVGAAVLADEEGSVAFAGGAFGYPPSHDVIDGGGSVRDRCRPLLSAARTLCRPSHRADARAVDPPGAGAADHSGA